MSKHEHSSRRASFQSQFVRPYRKATSKFQQSKDGATSVTSLGHELESLETRRMMSSTALVNGVLNVTGDTNSPNLVVVKELGNQTLMVFNDTHLTTYALSSVSSVKITDGTDGDRVMLNASTTVPITVVEGSSKDVVTGQSSNTTVVPPTVVATPASTPAVTATTPKAQITIVDGQSITVGQAVQVNGLNSTLGSGDNLTDTYTWNFGDASSQYNTLTGFNAAHLYTTPGTYTVSLTVTNNLGQSNTATTQISVASDTRNIIYVSNQGSDSNSGASPSQAVQTLAKAESMITSNTDILLQAGETFDLGSQFNIGAVSNVEISSYGTGARPVIMWTGARDMATMIDTASGASRITFENLTFDSIYDTDESESGMPFALQPGGTNIVVYNDEFLNVGYGINGNPSPNGVLVLDNVCPDQAALRAYFVYETGTNWTIIGNTVAGSEDEHDIRGTGSDINVQYNTLSNPSATGDSQAKDDIDFQGGSFYTIENNTLPATGGGVWIGPLQQNANPNTISWVVIEDNTLGSFFDFNPGVEHCIVQDNVAYRTDGFAGFDIDGYYATYNRESSDLRILDNTVITTDCTYGTFISVYSQVNGIDVENNLWVGNILYGVNQSAALYVTGTDFSSFSTIKNNVWPVNTGQYNGNYYFQGATGLTGSYLTESQWDAVSEIGTNIDQTVSADALDGYSYSIAGQIYGSRQAA